MKKIFIGIFIFALIAFLVTGILIFQKNKELKNNMLDDYNEKENTKNDYISGENEYSDIEKLEEKTIDLYGTYDENDLLINDVEENINVLGKNIEVKFKQIKGLKNKDVEDKINSEIKSCVIEKVKYIYKENDVDKDINIYSNIMGNFANVLSIEIVFNYYVDDQFKADEIYKNYELITGEHLNFEDLFVKDADLHNVVRKALYKRVLEDEVTDCLVSNINFDREKNEWTAIYWEYDETTNTSKEVEKTYIPKLTDYEINKKLKKYMNNENKEFSFTPRSIRLNMDDDYYYSLDFIDIAEEVVIYDKFLTNENLYEAQNVGMKNIWTCSIPTNYDGVFLEYGFATENLFYEIKTDFYYYIKDDYPFNKSIERIKEKALEHARNELETYMKIAKQNLHNFYVCRLSPRIDIEYSDNTSKLISSGLYKKVNYVDFNLKAQAIDGILECYRYHNVGFYISALELLNGGEYGIITSRCEWIELESNQENKIYDARNLKEITDIKDIFRINVDYMDLVKEKLSVAIDEDWELSKLNIEEKQKLIENAKYTISVSGIRVTFDGMSNYILIYFDKFHPSVLNIYDLNMFILEYSQTRKYEKWELSRLSLEDLNIAYNEIFARHGHEFKSAELKEYFNNLYWYNPILNKTVTLEELNEIEKYNLEIIKSAIEEKKNT